MWLIERTTQLKRDYKREARGSAAAGALGLAQRVGFVSSPDEKRPGDLGGGGKYVSVSLQPERRR
jgi:hypothetical protein